ncbi:sensor histidine kinase [Actinokineospora enzanensis]|uniref:sensor histidine kinase n=1 Tax=Actinokineospora enzanensis TaxID=155975 RepID=UPI000363DA94|nr:histidine kinase [Actinokineospora enzanensis]
MFGERLYTWSRGHEATVDTAVAIALAAVCVLFGLLVRAGADYHALTLALCAPLMWRRRAPVPCAAVVVAIGVAQWLIVRDTIGALPADLAIPLTVHAVAAYGPAWAGGPVLAAGLLGAVLGGVSWPQLSDSVIAHVITGAFLGSTVLVGWAFGMLHRVRGKQVRALAERTRLLEVEQDQRARLAMLSERARIAREMHDILGHSLAVVIAQADGGRYAAAVSPAAGQTALATIGDSARRALADTRRVLGVLRDPGLSTGGPPPPQPGLRDIPELVDRVRAGGLPVELVLEVPAGSVDAGLALVVHRVVQEGLTNVIKHAGVGVRAEVLVCWKADVVRVEVRDDGCGVAGVHGSGRGDGYGLMGLSERAQAYGGTVRLVPLADGGHVLEARIPVPT